MNFNFLAILAFLFLNSLIFNGGKIPLRRLSEEKTNNHTGKEERVETKVLGKYKDLKTSLVLSNSSNTNLDYDTSNNINKTPKTCTSTCVLNFENILYKPDNEKEEIQKIRDLYSEIEKSKLHYVRYEFFKDKNGDNYLVNPNEFDIEDEGEQFFFKYKGDYFEADGGLAFYFNKTGELVHVDQRSGSSIAISSGGSSILKYYYSPGASYPFFIYSYSHSYLMDFQYQDDNETIFMKENFSEHRIYSELNSTLNENCPKIIRGLVKQYTFKETMLSEDYSGMSKTIQFQKEFNKLQNQKLPMEELSELIQNLIVENNFIKISKLKKLIPN